MQYYHSSSYFRWLFQQRRRKNSTDEVSTSYGNFRRSPHRPEPIANDALQVRVIYFIREPVGRNFANMRHLCLRGHKLKLTRMRLPISAYDKTAEFETQSRTI